jgi:integrase
MSAFERPNGSGRWVAKYQLRGEQVWVDGGPWKTKAAALAAEDRDRQRRLARRTDEACASFAERWLEEWPRKASSTRTLYTQAAQRFADEFGSTPIGEVERLSARSWALGVPRNISKIIGTMYEDARNVGLVETNPFSNLRLPHTERTQEVVPPTLDEFAQLLNGCTVLGGYAAEMRALIQFTAWTGLRAGEVQGLQWKDVGLDSIHVRRSRKDDGSYGRPKNGHEREIALPVPAQVLDQVPRRQDSPFVFHTPRGEVLKKGNLYYNWNRARDNSGTSVDRIAAGVSPIRFHDLRHFCATRLLEMGLDHFAVSVQLGHEDGGALVMSRYGHPSKDAARERLHRMFSDADVGGGGPHTPASPLRH